MQGVTDEIHLLAVDEQRTPSDRTQRVTTTGWLRSLRAAARRAPQSTHARLVEELEVELSLLREENARLKVKRQRARDRPVHERVRELMSNRAEAATDDESWELLADCKLLRADLTDACREIERSVRETRQRLESLALDGGRGRGDETAAGQTMHDNLEHVA
jgi:hypothetical protein